MGDLALAGTTVNGVALYGGDLDEGTVFRFDLRPRFSIAAAGADVRLSWPSYANDYQLEQSTTIAPPSWSNVLGSPTDDGTNRSITLPVPAESAAVFHRLRR